MQTLTQPNALLKPFCEDGTKNAIPLENTDTSNPQKADLKYGFPVKTQGSPDEGKLPPERADFNGLGYLTTLYDFFYQCGGTFTFDEDVSTAIGGYPLGARLWHTTDAGMSMILRSTKINNTDNFKTDSSYIGTSWVIESMAGIDNSSVSLFDYKFSDKIINKMAWVKSDDNSWLYSATYSTAYQHLCDDVGFKVFNDEGTAKINVSAGGYTAGDYIRSSSDDVTYDGILYYAWKYSTSILYFTLDTSSMTADETVASLQGQRIYKYENSVMSLTIHKVLIKATDSYTINGSTIDLNVFIGSDGHRVVLVNTNENEDVDAVFNGLGVAWYYVLDKTNLRFKLPRTRYGVNGYRTGVGKYIPESLPNITGEVSQMGLTRGGAQVDKGALYHTEESNNYQNLSGATFQVITGIYLDASRDSSTYQNNAPVQERSNEMYLYFYLGDFTDTAIQNTAGINASTINSKADTDFGNVDETNAHKLIGNRLWISEEYDLSASANVVISHNLNLSDTTKALAIPYIRFTEAQAGYDADDIISDFKLLATYYVPSGASVVDSSYGAFLNLYQNTVVIPRIALYNAVLAYNKSTGVVTLLDSTKLKVFVKIIY